MIFAAIITLLSASLVLGEPNSGVYIGDLMTRQHNIKGAVYAMNESTIVVKNFQYDGTGPGTTDQLVLKGRMG